jgi:hypothetical protein
LPATLGLFHLTVLLLLLLLLLPSHVFWHDGLYKVASLVLVSRVP